MGDLGLFLGLGRFPGEGNDNPLQYSCLENPHGQRSLVGYSPWGLKESDTKAAQHTLLLWSRGPGRVGSSSWDSWALEHRLSNCGVGLVLQRVRSRLLHWQTDSL